ncbi:hypothetical protein SB6095_00470 [Klebsiella quasivariicola]|uniref:hypothetical protein n=1 Tax=Klebsiella TaxID=570 RepID=UPI000E2B184A|nr:MULTISPECIES: hypothetical protein [Klebsiella]MEA1147530.1 hypothetical protein [Klebsiella pneumoniae]MDK6604661.1 hypothetical protein [Klebsiella quasivariicola]MDK7205139.1 hypothetical protein [Klebsiella quasivariicola]SXD46888.1 Uncharacterised protein [Klebsiella quasivariicola]VGP73733.1 hypothetical protein SB6095_00470 [Klebsiella quasivariicola]
MVRKTTFTLTLFALLVTAPQAFASFDIEDCAWGDPLCLLKGAPILTPDNDSRDNLLRLLSEEKAFALPVQDIPADVSRSREVYFAYHPAWDSAPAPASPLPAQHEDETFTRQIAALNIDPAQVRLAQAAERPGASDNELENRFVSNTLAAVSQFNAALLAAASLNPQQRHDLALARLKLFYGADIIAVADILNSFPADTDADLFAYYLSGIAHFYGGSYAAATEDFTRLLGSKQGWLTETAQYMLMRTALNKSSQNSVGQYGDFDIARINREDALLAQKEALTYLQHWPDGLYANSARGMLRRINWYLQAWPQLAGLYEQAFQQATDAQELRQLVSEYDNVFGMPFYNQPVQVAFPDAPEISYVELLRALRLDINHKPALTQAQLDASKAVFEKSGKLSLWRDLQLQLWNATDNDAAILQAITPANTLPANNILAFNEQVLYGEALMGQQRWPAAADFWRQLIKLSHNREQQQYLQAKLAATLVYSGDVAAIFAPDSAVTNLRFRSRVLKTQASPERLRQQATQGPNNEERTIALHTLLVRDLTEHRFSDWLKDKKLVSAITQPVIDEAFDDVNLSSFDWNGDAVEAGYACRSLNDTVAVLSQNANDAHALNCLGEFFRTTRTHVDLWKDEAGNDVLESAIHHQIPQGQYDRQRYYQQVITSPKAEPEDKSYALYRAILCYAPSGNNECGGEEVDKLQRKGWFTLLKTQYPGSPWAQKLKYYW